MNSGFGIVDTSPHEVALSNYPASLRTGDLVRDRDVMEEAHGEARRLVEQGALSAELSRFVQERWQDQFGLIEVG